MEEIDKKLTGEFWAIYQDMKVAVKKAKTEVLAQHGWTWEEYERERNRPK